MSLLDASTRHTAMSASKDDAKELGWHAALRSSRPGGRRNGEWIRTDQGLSSIVNSSVSKRNEIGATTKAVIF